MTYQIDRELDFHNALYKENLGQRKKILPIYQVSRIARKMFYNLVSRYVSQEATILDYGCGQGALTIFLAKMGVEVIGIDISDEALIQAQKQACEAGITENISFIKMDAQNLKFNDSSFDLVCGISIIHHLNPERSYSEISRVLKPTGRAIFLELLGHNVFINLFRRCTPKFRSSGEQPLHVGDIYQAKRYFDKIDCEWFSLVTLMAIPFVKTFLREPLLIFSEKLDNVIIRNHPYVGKYGWQVIIQLERPYK